MRKTLVVMVAAGAVLVVPAVSAEAAVKPVRYKNCAALNKVYKHGVGRPKAKDRVRGKTRPVTNFTVDLKTYTLDTGLDRDRDGVACEKR
jgi:hypothetical protein